MAPRLDIEERKKQLAEAVWQVILERGISAVSVRNVAEQAGIVVGSLRHVFPTRAELMKFSAELMVQRATERVLSVPPSDEPQQYALEIVRQLLPLEADSRAEFEVNLALATEVPALPELASIRDDAHQKLHGVALRLVELVSGHSRGSEEVEVSAQRLHALIDGLAFHLLHRPVEDDPQWALDIIRAELTANPKRVSGRRVVGRSFC